MVRLYVKLESNEVGHLHAQVKGKASLFIPAYLLALGVMDLEMYATGSRLPALLQGQRMMRLWRGLSRGLD